jgi:hypothetical protein
LLKQVPLLKERLVRWQKLAAQRARAAKADAKPLSRSGRRKLIDSKLRAEIQVLRRWCSKSGRLPSKGAGHQEEHLAALLDTIARSADAYSFPAKGLLENVPGFKQYATKRSRPSQTLGAPLSKKLRQASSEVLDLLRKTTFRSQARYNVATDNRVASSPQGVSLGMNLSVTKGFTISKGLLATHCELVKALCLLARKAKPNFPFTSIQVNKSFATALHCDANNMGQSLTICLGNFTGGELYIHGEGQVDVSSTFYEFDGNIPHLTCPFKGERFCIIFFTNQSYERLRKGDVKYLKDLGFNWPEAGLRKRAYGPRAPRLLAAAAALPEPLIDFAGPLNRMLTNGSGAAAAAVATA